MRSQDQLEGGDIAPFGPASHVQLASGSSKHRYVLALLFLVGAVALTLSACGGSGSTNPPASRPSTTSSSPSTPTSKPSVALPSTTPPPPRHRRRLPPPRRRRRPRPPPPPRHRRRRPRPRRPPRPRPRRRRPRPRRPPTTEAPTTTAPTTASSAESTSTTIAVAAPSGSSTSSTPWGWIVVGIVLVAGLIVGLVLLLRARSRRAALGTWRRDARPALQQATIGSRPFDWGWERG